MKKNHFKKAKIEDQEIFFEGISGHLATVTSAEENTFLMKKILPLAETKKDEDQGKWVTGETWNYRN